MITSPVEARYEVFDRLQAVFAATDWTSLIGYADGPILIFQGRESPEAPPGDLPHIKAFIRHIDGGNGSLTNDEGLQRFYRDAILIVQCFGPMSRGDGLEVAVNIATICQRAFQGYKSTNCIWFRRCRIQEQDPSGNWDQCNFDCALEYDEVN